MVYIQIRRDEAGRIKIVLPYDPGLIAKIRWHPEEKCWSVPSADKIVERLLTLFAGEQVEVAPSLRLMKYEGVLKQPAPTKEGVETATSLKPSGSSSSLGGCRESQTSFMLGTLYEIAY